MVLGRRQRSVLGTNRHWRGFYDAPRPCLADLVLAGLRRDSEASYEIFAAGSVEGGLSAENWCVMPQLGERRYLAIDAGPIRAETGELVAVVETLRDGHPSTPFMNFGDVVRIEMLDAQGNSLFGAIEQQITQVPSA